jgi:hypothetical protein
MEVEATESGDTSGPIVAIPNYSSREHDLDLILS